MPLRQDIRKRKAALADLEKFREHRKAIKIDVEETDFVPVGDLVEQAEQVMKEGYAQIAQAVLVEMKRQGIPTE